MCGQTHLWIVDLPGARVLEKSETTKDTWVDNRTHVGELEHNSETGWLVVFAKLFHISYNGAI